MTMLLAAVALATTQAAPAAPVDHSRHDAAQHAQHQGEHKCCTEVNGKMECRMMKGHDARNQGQGGQHGRQGHGSSN